MPGKKSYMINKRCFAITVKRQAGEAKGSKSIALLIGNLPGFIVDFAIGHLLICWQYATIKAVSIGGIVISHSPHEPTLSVSVH